MNMKLEFSKVDGNAIATHIGGGLVIARCTGFEAGNGTHSIDDETCMVKIHTSIEYIDSEGNQTGIFEPAPYLKIIVSKSDLPNTDPFSVEMQEWFVDTIVSRSEDK